MSNKAIKRIIEVFKREKRFILLSHESPDGDCIGSQLAVAAVLKRLKKDVVVLSEKIPAKYRFLPGAETAVNSIDKQMKDRIAVFFDTPSLERLGGDKNGGSVPYKLIINIDHHISNKKFGDINWVEPRASSVGEMIFFLVKNMKFDIDKAIGASLYTAILTDTGMFQYANTTRRTHAVVGQLLNSGIDPFAIYQQLYENAPLARLRLVKECLSTLGTDCGGKVVFMWITQEMFRKTGASSELAEDIINFARSVEGAVVAVVFKETEKKNIFKVSFRSKSKLADVNKIASNFGGGGHMAAAGCTISGNKEEIQSKVLQAIRKTLARLP